MNLTFIFHWKSIEEKDINYMCKYKLIESSKYFFDSFSTFDSFSRDEQERER